MRVAITITIILTLTFNCFSQSKMGCKLTGALKRTIMQIDSELDDTFKYDFKMLPEDIACTKHHFGLGKGIRNGFGLWSGGSLKRYFKRHGIYHPDDMSGATLTSYHRYLNNKPIDLKGQADYYRKYWEIAKLGSDTLNKYWASKNDWEINDYLILFKTGTKVRGNLQAYFLDNLEETFNDFQWISFVGEVESITDDEVNVKIISISPNDKGLTPGKFNFGDSIKTEDAMKYFIEYQVDYLLSESPWNLYFIPDE